jgi:uncharacterized protein YjbI with pentapeptide repeats
LKQGVKVWNKWRKESYVTDLRGADLGNYNLAGVDFSKSNLIECNLSKVNLTGADLFQSNLSGANLLNANLSDANLQKATLYGADLRHVDLRDSNLSYSILQGSDLRDTNFRNANLKRTDLSLTTMGFTTFLGVNLGEAFGLDQVTHYVHSPIDTETIKLSKGNLPTKFLQGCGLSDLDIEYSNLYKLELSNQEINNIIYKIYDLRANQAIQVSPLFISYSHADTPFVERLEPRLTEKGIRFWRDVHNMTSGRMEKQVDHAMRQNPTVILILSENSIRSDWVEHEARLARELEKEIGRDVLCPIALDDSWKSAKWPARLMEQIKEYNILDYSNWKNDKTFGQVFNKMISGLDMFYKSESPK